MCKTDPFIIILRFNKPTIVDLYILFLHLPFPYSTSFYILQHFPIQYLHLIDASQPVLSPAAIILKGSICPPRAGSLNFFESIEVI